MTGATIGAVLADRSARAGDRDFLVCDDERLSYRQAHERSGRLAKGLLARRLGHGSHIALLMPNGADFVVGALAALRIGAVAVPLSTFSTAAELEGLLSGADCEALLAFSAYRSHRFDEEMGRLLGLDWDRPPPIRSLAVPTLRQVFFTGRPAESARPEWSIDGLEAAGAAVSDAFLASVESDVHPSDVAVMVHTSGSTSAPKGVVHTHGALLGHLEVLNDMRRYVPGEILFSNSPFFWIGGFSYTLLGTLLAGATLVCSRAVDAADVLDLIERERPTMVNGYASSIAPIAADPSFAGRDLSSIRRGNLYPIMPAELRPADPALRANMLGLTEAGSVILASPDEGDLPEELRGSFGAPTPDSEARVVVTDTGHDCRPGETGELWLRGPQMMQGYYGRERYDTFDPDGWYHAGDLVRTDAGGNWFFLGRADDMIKTAGANVSPAEVAAAVLSVLDRPSYVLGLPDPDRGAVVAAVVVTDGVQDEVDLDALRGALASRLSAYKVPKRYLALPSAAVPLLASGKPDMARLAEMFDES